MSDWGWPQWVIIAMSVFVSLMAVGMHGKRREPWNVHAIWFSTGLQAWILWMGGFWS